MILTKTHGIDKDLWYRQGLMISATPIVLAQTHGIESVLLNHTHTRGPSVTRMRDLSYLFSPSFLGKGAGTCIKIVSGRCWV